MTAVGPPMEVSLMAAWVRAGSVGPTKPAGCRMEKRSALWKRPSARTLVGYRENVPAWRDASPDQALGTACGIDIKLATKK